MGFTPLDKHSESRRQHLPDAAAVLCLQGKLWQAHKEHNKAVDCYAAALKLNPFMWDAFLSLCETGKRSSTAGGDDLFSKLTILRKALICEFQIFTN